MPQRTEDGWGGGSGCGWTSSATALVSVGDRGGGGPELAVAAVVLLRGCWFWKCDGCLWFLRYQSCGALHGHLVYLSVGQHKATEAQR